MKRQGIYILTNSVNGKQYVGKDTNLPRRINEHLSGKCPRCPHIHRAINKHGREAFDVEIIEYPGASHEALNAIEKWHIARLDTYKNGYNCTKGGEGFDSETVQKNNQNRIVDSTHHFQDPEWQRQYNTSGQRIEDGTHNFQGENNPSVQRSRDGTHQWLGENNPSHQRVADGTHNFLENPELCYKAHRKSLWVRRLKTKARRREFYRLFASLLFTKSLCEIYRHRQLTREGFFDREIPDTSHAEQQALF